MMNDDNATTKRNTMEANTDYVRYEILQKFIYHLAYYKALHLEYTKETNLSTFWTMTIDAHLMQATLYWCKVFGKDKNNDFHWKNIISEAEQKDFLLFIDKHGITKEIWHEIWHSMQTFRDKYVAHRDKKFSTSVPHFDIPLKIVYYYQRWSYEHENMDSYENFEYLFNKIKSDVSLMVPIIVSINEKNQNVPLFEYSII